MTIMRIFKSILFALAVVLLATGAQAQTLIDNTTFSAALTGIGTQASPYEKVVSLTATTCTGCTFGAGTMIYVGHEAMTVAGSYVSGTTNIPVNRGVYGTPAGPHSTSEVVFVGPPVRFKGVGATSPQLGDPSGASCSKTNYAYMPWINISNGNVWVCDLLGSWLGTNPAKMTFNSTQKGGGS